MSIRANLPLFKKCQNQFGQGRPLPIWAMPKRKGVFRGKPSQRRNVLKTDTPQSNESVNNIAQNEVYPNYPIDGQVPLPF